MKSLITLFLPAFLFFSSFLHSQSLKPEEIFEMYNKSIVVIYPVNFDGVVTGQGSQRIAIQYKVDIKETTESG